MCGIAGVYIKDRAINTLNLDKMVNHLLLGIEHRGTDATGVLAVTTNNCFELQKEPVKASQFIPTRKAIPEDTKMVLLHTRLKTKGDEQEFCNNHPVMYQSCFATHNGMIMNDDILFNTFNLERHAEVDSEVIPAMLGYYGLDRADSALEELAGSMAVAAVDPINNPGRLILARGSHSPLMCFNTPNMLIWASTSDVIRNMWSTCIGTPPGYKKIAAFGEGDMVNIQDDKIEKGNFNPDPGYVHYSRTTTYRWPYTSSKLDECDQCGEDGAAYLVHFQGSMLCPKCNEQMDSDKVTQYTALRCDFCEIWESFANLEETTDIAGNTKFACIDCFPAAQAGLVCEVKALPRAGDSGYDPVLEWEAYGAHEHMLSEKALIITAAELGYEKGFLHWLLFVAQNDVLFGDLYLTDMFEDAMGRYTGNLMDIEEEFGFLPYPDHYRTTV